MRDPVFQRPDRLALQQLLGLAQHQFAVVLINHFEPEIGVGVILRRSISRNGHTRRPMRRGYDPPVFHLDGINVIGRRLHEAPIAQFAFFEGQFRLPALGDVRKNGHLGHGVVGMGDGHTGRAINAAVARIGDFVVHALPLLDLLHRTPGANLHAFEKYAIARLTHGDPAHLADHGRVHIFDAIIRRADINQIAHGLHHGLVFLLALLQLTLNPLLVQRQLDGRQHLVIVHGRANEPKRFNGLGLLQCFDIGGIYQENNGNLPLSMDGGRNLDALQGRFQANIHQHQVGLEAFRQAHRIVGAGRDAGRGKIQNCKQGLQFSHQVRITGGNKNSGGSHRL
ncbi:MAG: hypothetical protein WC381_05365 [Kiritimatiellia bacterium]